MVTIKLIYLSLPNYKGKEFKRYTNSEENQRAREK